MASGKRASMREGPLAQLFRKTEDERGRRQPRSRARRRPASRRRAAAGRPVAEPAPATEPAAASPPGGALVRAARHRGRPARRGARRAAASEEQPERARRSSRYEGVPTPEERLRSVFSADIPENILDASPEPAAPPSPSMPEPPRYGMPSAGRMTEPVLRVVGVGGAGVNAVNRMIEAEVEGVEFMAVNTDIQSLEQSAADNRVHIGGEITRGLGSGSNPELGRAAALEDYDHLKSLLKGSDMVFVTAGAGGGTGTGAAPVVARIAREVGALTVGIVDQAVLLRGRPARRAGRPRRRGAGPRGGHAHRHPERAPADGARQVDLDGRGVPRGRRRAAPGRAGHLRPDHAARA